MKVRNITDRQTFFFNEQYEPDIPLKAFIYLTYLLQMYEIRITVLFELVIQLLHYVNHNYKRHILHYIFSTLYQCYRENERTGERIDLKK